jgi:hypothetical protein
MEADTTCPLYPNLQTLFKYRKNQLWKCAPNRAFLQIARTFV